MDKINLSVVIPVFRAADTLRELYYKLLPMLLEQCQNFEIIFVEDCGGDNSWQIITELAKKDHRVHGLRMSRNYGQHNALLSGIRAASYEFIITMDDDLQHPPTEIPKLITKLKDGYDVVYGSAETGQHGFFRNVASELTKISLQSIMGARNARQASAFRLFRTELRDAFASYKSPHVNIDVLLSWATISFGVCKVKHEARKYGKSGYNTRKLLTQALNMITGFSTVPLKIASLIGIMFALFGFGVLGYVLIRYFITSQAVPGFSFLASIISIFAGAQLLSIGIIGEYLGRMYQRTIECPAYFLRETTRKKEPI